MAFRITPHQFTKLTAARLSRQAQDSIAAQSQISSGLRIQKPSDDPAGIQRSLIQKDAVSRLKTHVDGISRASSRLNQAHVQLRDAQQVFLRAREIGLTARQTTEPAERQILAREVEGLLSRLHSITNATDESGYLFSGAASRTAPFPEIGDATARTAYEGSEIPAQLFLSGDIDRQSLTSGEIIFQPTNRGDVIVTGTTGAAAGTGTATLTGERVLQVRHTSTTYAAGSGVATGLSSVGGDTVLGTTGTHTLQITDTSGTGAFGTVSLNGGADFNFTATDTDLRIEGPNGNVVYVDTTGITAGFSGTVDITGNGTLSVDGGASTVPISFSANEAVVDGNDNGVVWLDTTDISRAGDERLEFMGTSDVFQILTQLRDDLRNERGLSNTEYEASIGRRLEDIEVMEDHLLDMIGIQSVALEQMDTLTSRTEDSKLAGEVEYSENVSADVAEAILRLQEAQSLQQVTMATVSRILSPSLAEYL